MWPTCKIVFRDDRIKLCREVLASEMSRIGYQGCLVATVLDQMISDLGIKCGVNRAHRPMVEIEAETSIELLRVPFALRYHERVSGGRFREAHAAIELVFPHSKLTSGPTKHYFHSGLYVANTHP